VRGYLENRGEREPVAENSSESGRAENWRVEIFLRESDAKGRSRCVDAKQQAATIAACR
jgi:hypothetical protein